MTCLAAKVACFVTLGLDETLEVTFMLLVMRLYVEFVFFT